MIDYQLLLIAILDQHAVEVRALGHEELALIWQKQADDLRAQREAQIAELSENSKTMIDNRMWNQ